MRAIAACPVPVVSAVGHEQDTPLSDLVADARASTPSVAARLVVPGPRTSSWGGSTARARRSHARPPRCSPATVTASALASGRPPRHHRPRGRGSPPARPHARAAAACPAPRRRTPARAPRPVRPAGSSAVTAGDARARLRDRPRAGGIVSDAAQVSRAPPSASSLARGGFEARVEDVAVSEPTFEEAQRELEAIVRRLETGEVPLDEAIALWERGEELYRLCSGKPRRRAGADRGARQAGRGAAGVAIAPESA